MSPPTLVVIAYCLLGLAWLGGNPLGAVPDEPAHYIKAIGVAGGHPAGDRLPVYGGIAPKVFVWRCTRIFTVPYRLLPPRILCIAFHPELSAACQNGLTLESRTGSGPRMSYVGTYQPYLYLLPGLFARAGRSFWSAMLLARLANLLLSILLVGLAAFMLWDASCGYLSLVGLMVAITPMSLFLFASVNTSGPEIAGGICLAAGLIALGGREKSPVWYWRAAAAGGAVLVLGRSTGIGFAVLIATTAAVLFGWETVKLRLQRSGRSAFWSMVIVLMAMAAGFAWELAMHPHPASSLGLAMRTSWPVLEQLPGLLLQQVGLFGWMDTLMPKFVYAGWLLLLMMLLGLAFVVGSKRQRFAMMAAVAAFIFAQEFIGAVVMPPTGFGMQGRYTLPLAVAVPMVAGEILRANFARVWAIGLQHAGVAVGCVVGLMQAIGWYANAHRYAVGINGTWMFFAGVCWHPPGGWSPWMVLAIAGALGLALACWKEQTQPSLSPGTP